jgi:multiple sugar transport system permease protein
MNTQLQTTHRKSKKNINFAFEVNKAIRRSIWYIVMSVIAMFMLYPFVFAFMGGLMDPTLFRSLGTMMPIPNPAIFENYLTFFTQAMWRPFFNTVARSAWYTIVNTYIAVTIGYFMARKNFWGKKQFFMIIVIAQLIPGVLTLIPTFVMMARFPLVGGNNILGAGGSGFINNPAVLFILIGGGQLMNAILFRQAMYSLPPSFEEAAEMDGCGYFQTMIRVILPMQRPIIAFIAMTSAINTWNDWFTPFLYISDLQYNTLPAYVGMLVTRFHEFTRPNYALVFALSTVATLPPVAIFLVFQRNIVQGLASAGIKG